MIKLREDAVRREEPEVGYHVGYLREVEVCTRLLEGEMDKWSVDSGWIRKGFIYECRRHMSDYDGRNTCQTYPGRLNLNPSHGQSLHAIHEAHKRVGRVGGRTCRDGLHGRVAMILFSGSDEFEEIKAAMAPKSAGAEGR
jgi:hypothetical protein